MSKELIRLRDLCMAFDDELVLDHINLYINDKSSSRSRTQRVRQNHHAAYHRRFRDAYVGRCPVRRCEDQ